MHSSNQIIKFADDMIVVGLISKNHELRKVYLPLPLLTTFYRGTIKSITAWFGNCTVSERKTLQWILRTAEKIIGVSLPSITDIYSTRCILKANRIVNDPTHPSDTLSCHLEKAPSSFVVIMGNPSQSLPKKKGNRELQDQSDKKGPLYSTALNLDLYARDLANGVMGALGGHNQ
ncbi:hypothetical protein QTP70_027107 [Hemibagrus guttatus]|uniref:Reverse transcriptase domain-containing protein n=1 Tax=Hemibagrus guttatus TaxID=175788 RepID=A0AAE0UL05_9TELE|nr:hypothetical protein QTP70_027107 [Hemibagrus guttatus]